MLDKPPAATAYSRAERHSAVIGAEGKARAAGRA